MELMNYFQSIVEQMDGVAIIDRQGEYIYVNRSWERIMGRKFDEVNKKMASSIVSATLVAQCMDNCRTYRGISVNHNGREMFSNYMPIMQEEEVVGCFIHIVFEDMQQALSFSETAIAIKNELNYYKNALDQLKTETKQYDINQIIGNSTAIQNMKRQILNASRSQSTVLIYGETGSGKELVANSIHNLSARATKPFVKINCSAIPLELAESEFFGYESGSFTGANRAGKEGLFEAANGGSLFLDEINQMSYNIQPKILRVLQEKEVMRVGGKRSKPIDVRLIAASNQPLEVLVAEEKFRQDLYFRLNVVKIKVPPLRERLEDIPLLAESIINKLNIQLGMRVEGLSDDVIKKMQGYRWPGNIRELQNLIEQAMNVKSYGVLDMDCFDDCFDTTRMRSIVKGTLKEQLQKQEKIVIIETYKRHNKNKRKTAEELGVSRPLLYQRLKEYGMD